MTVNCNFFEIMAMFFAVFFLFSGFSSGARNPRAYPLPQPTPAAAPGTEPSAPRQPPDVLSATPDGLAVEGWPRSSPTASQAPCTVTLHAPCSGSRTDSQRRCWKKYVYFSSVHRLHVFSRMDSPSGFRLGRYVFH